MYSISVIKLIRNVSRLTPWHTFFLCKGNKMVELEVVNTLLRSIGAQVVNSINSPQPDVQSARRAIQRVMRRTQQRGWWFNMEYSVTLYPDAAKEITVSQDVHTISPRVGGEVVLRGKRLFNTVTNTYKFEDNVICKLIRILPWDELPESAQMYVMYKAAAEFIRDELGDSQKAGEYNDDAQRALVQLTMDDLESRPVNSLKSAQAIKMKSGVRPYGNSLRDQWWRR